MEQLLRCRAWEKKTPFSNFHLEEKFHFFTSYVNNLTNCDSKQQKFKFLWSLPVQHVLSLPAQGSFKECPRSLVSKAEPPLCTHAHNVLKCNINSIWTLLKYTCYLEFILDGQKIVTMLIVWYLKLNFHY